MLEASGQTVAEAKRIVERNAGSRAAEDLDGPVEMHRTLNPGHRHLGLETT